ncbi:MAG: sigma-70 family RNA polymerase sigma factor [Pseudomonadota bacterium]
MLKLPDEISELIARIALQDRGAFDRLYATVAPKLYGVAFAMVEDRSRAEQVLSAVFTRVWQQADRFPASSTDPMVWLTVLTREEAISKLRSDRRPRKLKDDPHSMARRHQQKGSTHHTRIEACLTLLTPEGSEAIRSAYLQGLSYAELAERFEMPVEEMRKRMRRSLHELKDSLSA